ncbi:MAG: hypothetical protein PUP93_18325 [Rhizonema sp. NSF051]|nr:hypothetical protein [Rhizonema sp. NSF051]
MAQVHAARHIATPINLSLMLIYMPKLKSTIAIRDSAPRIIAGKTMSQIRLYLDEDATHNRLL